MYNIYSVNMNTENEKETKEKQLKRLISRKNGHRTEKNRKVS